MKRTALTIALGAVAVFAGCVDYTEDLDLERDGSGTIHLRMAADAESYEAMREMSAAFGGRDVPMESFDEEGIRDTLAARGSKARLESYRETTSDGDRVWEMEFSFRSIDDFADIGRALDDEEPDTPPFSFEKQTDGTWLFLRDLEASSGSSTTAPAPGEMPALPEGMEGLIDPENFDAESFDAEAMAAKLQEQMQDLMASMKGFSGDLEAQKRRVEAESEKRTVRFSVTFPGTIIESNATTASGNRAVWEYRFSDLQKMEGKIPALRATVKP